MNAILTQSRLKKALLGREKKPQDMKEETWQKLDEKALMAIQLCLADEVLDEFSTEKTTSSLWERLQDHYLKKSLANWLILKQRLFLRMHEGAPIKSHIADFTSIINELDKIKIKIKYEDQVLLLMCSLPFSYKSFRKHIIYRCKSTIKVNEVKEHLLNIDKIGKQLKGVSHRDDFGQGFFTKEKSCLLYTSPSPRDS